MNDQRRAIPAPEYTWGNIQAGLVQTARFHSYLAGIRDALGIPRDWDFDPVRRVFIPPPVDAAVREVKPVGEGGKDT